MGRSRTEASFECCRWHAQNSIVEKSSETPTATAAFTAAERSAKHSSGSPFRRCNFSFTRQRFASHFSFVILATICAILFSPLTGLRPGTVQATKLFARKNCYDETFSIEMQANLAAMVLTGTVEKMYVNSSFQRNADGLKIHKALVKIRRIIKGSSKDTQGSDVILIDGFGDPAICDSDARRLDTKIFFLSKIPTNDLSSLTEEFKLNSSLRRINLQNLARLSQTGHNLPYRSERLTLRRSKTIYKEPCERKLCAFGGVCKLNRTSKEAYCACATDSCDHATFTPVCGNDNVTYSNDCHLRSASCLQQKRIKVRFAGSCDAKDPCLEKVCSFGAQCVASVDGKNARCVCPEKCDYYGDSSGSRPVCGDNGQTYDSLCHMRMESCRKFVDIKVKFTGKCDPCNETPSLNCAEGTTCKLTPQREPECRCSSNCLVHGDDYVCASDGKTYLSQCAMRVEACKQRKDLRVIYSGRCEDGSNPCKDLKCYYGAECFIDYYNQTKCDCLMDCEPIMRPVCGKDGITYENECELSRQACKTQRYNAIDHQGSCGKGVCKSHQCPYGAVCVEKDGAPFCDCKACSPELSPVCGTNGITYDNLCKLNYEACLLKQNIYVKYDGYCKGCEGKSCDFYSVCVTDGKGNGTCVCPDKCIKSKDPVCGSDGRTYPNECELQMHSCRLNEFLTVAYRGTCDACEKANCGWGMRCQKGKCMCPTFCPKLKVEVCGSDSRRYKSECHMLKLACTQGRDIEVVSDRYCPENLEPIDAGQELGHTNLEKTQRDNNNHCNSETCKYAGICADDNGDGIGQCICDFDCSNPSAASASKAYQLDIPVCATDGIIYQNDCLMDLASCRAQAPIYKQTSLAKCDTSRPENDDCTITQYGCCSDGITIAVGPTDNSGCPMPSEAELNAYQSSADALQTSSTANSLEHTTLASAAKIDKSRCKCNRLGSFAEYCDEMNIECPCRPGVTGRRCDSCLPGFWGLHLIGRGNSGCIPCGCSAFGAQRDDCDQTMGRCVCKPGVLGMKCNSCPANKALKPQGCVDVSIYRAPKSCDEMLCQFGARCLVMDENRAECVCNEVCPIISSPYANQSSNGVMEVCGSDGNTYGSQCQLKQFACRLQQDIVVASIGPCSSSGHFEYSSVKPLKTTTTTTRQPYYDESNHIGDEIWATTTPLTALASAKTSEEPMVIIQTIHKPSSLKSKVGQRCLTDEDCLVAHSTCGEKAGKLVCLCAHGYAPTSGNSVCKEIPRDFNDRASPCVDKPCQNGGTCRKSVGDYLGYFCTCTAQYTGTHCEERLHKSQLYLLPMFGGKSYLQFNRLEDAYAHVSIKVEFKPMETEGLILFNGQSEDARGDFIALSMVTGFLEFRYDLGDGIIVLRSPKQLPIESWYKVEASRQGRKGKLHVNGQEIVSNVNNGKDGSKSLNLKTPLYLGKVPHMPDSVVASAGTRYGFMGCILSLEINGRTFDLRSQISVDIVKTHMIGECGANPCSSLPCLNTGQCDKISDTEFTCTCPLAFTGKFCETAMDACGNNPCQWGGTCQTHDDSFSCICPAGRTGKLCDQALGWSSSRISRDLRDLILPINRNQVAELSNLVSSSAVPEFHGKSYLELSSLPGDIEKSISIEIWLLARKRNGLVLFSGLLNDVQGYTAGDFISLSLVDGFAQFRYNLGAGIANITSARPLKLHQWTSIKLNRHLRNGTVQLNNETVVIGESPPPWDKLNLDNYPVYIGGVRNIPALKPLIGVKEGVDGIVQRVILNGMTIDDLLTAGILSSGVSHYNGPPCVDGICKNGGSCVPKLDDFVCHCPPDFNGKSCDDVIRKSKATNDDLQALRFDGQTPLDYKNKINEISEGQKENSFYLKFKTNFTSGLLLWENKGLTVRGDYIAIALVAGKVAFSFNLGKENRIKEVQSNVYVSDDKWHTARVWRAKRQGYLSVDEEEPVTFLSSPGATELNTDGKLWLGGCPKLPFGLPSSYYIGFVGCMAEMKIDNRPLNLTKDTKPRKFTFCKVTAISRSTGVT